MDKRNFRNTEKQISLLGFGCMRYPMTDERTQEIDEEKAMEMMDYAYKSGVNYFDTAYIYHNGLAEKFVGKALSRYPRESYNLATKMPLIHIEKEEDLERIFNEQLENLRVDYFDFYLAHNCSEKTIEMIKEFKIYDFLTEKKKEGKIKHLGFSFHDTPEVLQKLVDDYEWDFAQMQLNYMDWELQNAKLQHEILTKKGLPIIVMEPVRGGALVSLCNEAVDIYKNAAPDASVASWGFRFVGSQPNILTILSGMSTIEQVKDNIATMTDFKPLSEDEFKTIETALAAYKLSSPIPCTNCRYCMDCPEGVDIPKVLYTYNQYRVHNRMHMFKENYTVVGKDKQAHHCIKCNKCLEKCPQSIDIPTWMEKIDDIINNGD